MAVADLLYDGSFHWSSLAESGNYSSAGTDLLFQKVYAWAVGYCGHDAGEPFYHLLRQRPYYSRTPIAGRQLRSVFREFIGIALWFRCYSLQFNSPNRTHLWHLLFSEKGKTDSQYLFTGYSFHPY